MTDEPLTPDTDLDSDSQPIESEGTTQTLATDERPTPDTDHDSDSQPTESEGTTQILMTDAATDGAPMGLAEGDLNGGWEFIWAAYIITWCLLASYAIFVTVRQPKA